MRGSHERGNWLGGGGANFGAALFGVIPCRKRNALTPGNPWVVVERYVVLVERFSGNSRFVPVLKAIVNDPFALFDGRFQSFKLAMHDPFALVHVVEVVVDHDFVGHLRIAFGGTG